MEIAGTSTSKGGKTRQKKPNQFVEEWLKLFPKSSNEYVVDDQTFIDLYELCRDSTCHSVKNYELFRYFYCNLKEKILICCPWKKNLAKLIFPKVFLDVDLVKALNKSYNPATKSFHRHKNTILYKLDHASFIKDFGLEGTMSNPSNLVCLQGKFEGNTKAYIGNYILQHIPVDLK